MTNIFVLVLVLFLNPGGLYGQAKIKALTKNSAEFIRSHTIDMTGPWYYYPYALLKPGDYFENGEKIFLPHLWASSDHAIGFCTYRCLITLPPDYRTQPLALYMPDVYSNYRIWIDGKEFSGNGKVGASPETSESEWRPRLIEFVSGDPVTEIIIQVSNFHHHKGGMGKVPMVGHRERILHNIRVTTLGEFMLFSCMLIIGSATFFLFLLQRSSGLLYFSLLTFSWSVRSVFSNDYLAVQWIPNLSWEWVVRIEYITIYLTTFFGVLLVSSIFKNRQGRAYNIIYGSAAMIFTLVTIVSDPLFFTQYVLVYLAFSASLLLRILYLAIEAFINDRQGATLLLVNIFAGALLFMYVILSYLGLITFYQFIFNIGFLVVFGFGSISVIRHFYFRKSIRSSE